MEKLTYKKVLTFVTRDVNIIKDRTKARQKNRVKKFFKKTLKIFKKDIDKIRQLVLR